MAESTPGERLRAARERAGYASAAAAARAHRIHPQNLRDHEAGRRGVSPAHAAAYARAFGCSASWILYGEGGAGFGARFEAGRRGGRLVGRVGAGGRVEPLSEGVGEDDAAPAPPEFFSDAPAGVRVLRVAGDAMWPAYADGNLIYYADGWSDAASIRARLIGRECVVLTASGEEYVRRIEAGPSPDRFTLIGYNAPPMRDVALARAAPIVWVRKGEPR